MKLQDLIYEKRGRLAYITINRPQVMNAISPVTQRELAATVRDFNEDPDLWVAIITGAGDRAFSAGNDMKWQDSHPEEFRQYMESRAVNNRSVFRHLGPLGAGDLPREVWKPIIAAVNGHCLGGALELALHCDLIVASETATFGCPEVTHGWPAPVSVFYLPRVIPGKIAMEMLLTGDRISAARAYEVGLVNRVVPAAELMATATAYANRICENPPLAVRATKELVLRGRDMPLDYPPMAWHLLSDSVTQRVQLSEDREEGRRAFAEKRKPVFKGK